MINEALMKQQRIAEIKQLKKELEELKQVNKDLITKNELLLGLLETFENEMNRLKDGIFQIANGETDDLAGDPSKWSSTVAKKLLGAIFKNGGPVVPYIPLPPPKN